MQLVPWIFLLIIPAVTMKSFAEEKKQGTLELLLTKPLSLNKLVLGKFFGAFILVLISLLPTLLYIYTINKLSLNGNSLDIGVTIGSYLGLCFLSAVFIAWGLVASASTDNQIVAFLLGIFLCFLNYYGLQAFGEFLGSGTIGTAISAFGIQYHFDRMSSGILDTRDLLYFLAVTALLITATILLVDKTAFKKRIKSVGVYIGLFVGVLLLSNFIFKRIDLTEDQRFTLSPSTISSLEKIDTPIAIDILLNGEMPSEFRRLQSETKQLLEVFAEINPLVKFTFINPLEEDTRQKEILEQLQKQGLQPMEVSVLENGKTAIQVLVPWAVASTQKRSEKIPLVKNSLGATSEERVTQSVQQLEYALIDGLRKLVFQKKHKIAILKGNGQLDDVYVADAVRKLQEYYYIGAFTLDSVTDTPQKTLSDLQEFDLVINAKPTLPYSEEEKFVLDQFIMNGGKSLWFVESVAIEKDSLMGVAQSALAYPRDLKLNDLFFAYGVRINPVLVNDLYSAPIVLATGRGKETRFVPYPWFYSPLIKDAEKHPITTNLENIRFDFANQIDTLRNEVQKSILVSSSSSTKLEGVPKEVNLEVIREKPDMASYSNGKQNLAVLLEGKFQSTYAKRIKPFELTEAKEESIPTKMIVVADGDVIKNEVQKGQPLPLGYDRYTGATYGNKDFILNAVNYLLDDVSSLKVRNKIVTIPFLDMQKVSTQRSQWQLVNLIVPLLLLLVFRVLFIWYRNRKYRD